MSKHAVVNGAGLVGCLWAILLAQRGYQVDVFERRPDFRQAKFVGGRSINLAMSTRGWKAIEKAGIKDKIMETAIPMNGRMMHDLEGNLTFQPYGKEGEAIYSVSRGGLNLELLNIANTYDNVRFHFNQKCLGLDRKKVLLRFKDESNQKEHTVDAPLIFGADGAFSPLRYSMQKTPRFDYSQDFLSHGYKELSIPAAADGSHQIEKNALHIWPRGKFMLIALPNQDGSFTCTLFLPYEGATSFESLQTDEQILGFFKRQFPDTLPLMPDLLKNFKENPTAGLVTIRCNPWQYKEKILLIGDASHAIVPFYGQGMNSGFEDCTVLDEMMATYEDDWSKIMHHFNDSRPLDADAIANLALRNFIEMSDWVADPKFLLRKKIAAHLHEKYEDFMPVYSMVTFSHIPYHKAWQEVQAQDELFQRILALPNIEKDWKGERVEKIYLEWRKE